MQAAAAEHKGPANSLAVGEGDGDGAVLFLVFVPVVVVVVVFGQRPRKGPALAELDLFLMQTRA